MQTYRREPSPNERLYMDYERLYTTLDMQMIIEGEGILDHDLLAESVRQACKVCPGASVVLTPEMQWVDKGMLPPIYYISAVEALDWQINEWAILKTKIDYTMQPIAEIYVIEGQPYRILFRIFHGAMDGKGALKWIDNIFRAMNKQTLIPAYEPYNDVSFLKGLKHYNARVWVEMKYKVLKQKKEGNLDVYWKHIRIDGQHKQVIAKVAHCLTAYFEGNNQRFLIPVDMRRHKPESECTANLTLPIFLDTDKAMTEGEINKQLLRQLREHKELNKQFAELDYIAKAPRKLKSIGIKSTVKLQEWIGRFAISGILSHLGKINLEEYSTSSFRAKRFYSLPVQQPFSPIALVAVQSSDALEIIFSSSTKFISQGEMDRLEELLKQAFQQEDKAIELVGEETLRPFDLLENWNKQVIQHKDDYAVSDQDRMLTYWELDKKSDTLVNHLKQQGVKPQDELVVYMNKSIDFVVAVLACIKYGCMYCPLDVALPSARLKQMIEHVRPKVILTQSEHIINIQAMGEHNVVAVDAIEEESLNCKNDELGNKRHQQLQVEPVEESKVQEQQENKEQCKYKCGDKVYKIFTSGSTGMPKGVEITYEGLCNYLGWAMQYYQIGKPFVCPLMTSLGVDLTITTLFLPLITGGTLKIGKEQLDGESLEAVLKDLEINTIKLTPTHLKLIEQLDLKVEGKEVLIVGGEDFSTVLAKQIQARFGEGCRIFNEYGPTEATVGCMVYEYQEQLDQVYSSVPIGKPIAHTSIRVEKGRLFVGGKGLAAGYDDAEMTAIKFVTKQNTRMYDTGDVVYMNDKQQLMYRGRSDRQVKIRGNRVELGDIESCLCSYKQGVQAAVVYEPSRGKLRAYVVGLTKDELPQLQQLVHKQMPVYMVPYSLEVIEELPLTLAGKLDEKYLIALSNQEECISVANNREVSVEIEELTPRQKCVEQIWRKCLEDESLNIQSHDDFYDLGGDSLSLLTMNVHIARRFDTDAKRVAYEKQIEGIYEDLTLSNVVALIEAIGGWDES